MSRTYREPHRIVTRDAREDDDWFRRLPEDVQEETRQFWRGQQLEDHHWRERSRQKLLRAAWETGGLMTIPLLLANVLTAGPGVVLALLVAGFVVGAIGGVVAARCGAGRFGFSVAGLVGFAALQLPAVHVTDLLSVICAFLGAYMATHLFALYGMRREFRTLEGSE